MTAHNRWRHEYPPMRLTILNLRGQARRFNDFAIAVVRVEYELGNERCVMFTAKCGDKTNWLRPQSLLSDAFDETLGIVAEVAYDTPEAQS